jgi:hypothetical protein
LQSKAVNKKPPRLVYREGTGELFLASASFFGSFSRFFFAAGFFAFPFAVAMVILLCMV